MQSVTSRIWTHVAVFISYDDNYTTDISNHNQTLNVDKDSQQLQCVHENLRKRPTELRLEKNIGFRPVCFYPIHHIHQTLHQVISIFFILYKMTWISKTFLKKIRWKGFWKRSWEQNQQNFTWEESISFLINGKKWFKIMANLLLIEINSLLNYSWINYILVKRKLFMTQQMIWCTQ